MDAFEELVSEIFWHEGYWVQRSVKVDLTKEEKRLLKNPSLPRPEIDLVAYKGITGELLLIECKSYIDSGGVSITAFDGSDPKFANRFKIFNNKLLFDMIVARLRKQFSLKGTCPEDVGPRLGLVAGHVRGQSRKALRDLFAKNNWLLWDEFWLREKLKNMSKSGYENSVAMMAVKLLRNKSGDIE